MIPRHRNHAIVLSAAATVMTVLVVVFFRKLDQVIDPETGRFVQNHETPIYVLMCYVSAMILWCLASVSFAKAKGYDSSRMGRIFWILLVVGFCCCGPLPLVFPLLGFFAKDKTGSGWSGKRRSRRRRSRSGETP